MIRRHFPIAAAALAVALAAPARAEVVQLIDKTQVAGKILHYYDGVFQIELPGGQKMDLPREKIRAITFQLPPPRAELSTPEKTFQRWREAMLKGELPKIIDCYGLMYQGMLAAQLGQSPEDFKKMQKDVEGTRFDVKSAKVTGEHATLKVQRQKGEDVMTAEIPLVLENGEWKMTPN